MTFRKSYLTIVNALEDAFKGPPDPAGVDVMRAREIAKHAIWDIGLRVLSELQLSSGVAATPPPLAPPVLILDNDGRHEVKHLDLSRPVCIGLPQFGNEIVLNAERRFHDQQAHEHARAKTSRVHLIIFPLGVKMALVDSGKARGITIRDRDPPVPDGSSSSNAYGAESEEVCVECEQRHRCVRSAPCGHYAFCQVCFDKMARHVDRRCPVCCGHMPALDTYVDCRTFVVTRASI